MAFLFGALFVPEPGNRNHDIVRVIKVVCCFNDDAQYNNWYSEGIPKTLYKLED